MEIRVFQSIQRNFAILGIDSYQTKQSHAFNVRNALVLFIFALSIISGCVSVAHASTFKENINAFHIAVTVAFGGLTFVIVMCQMKIMFQFIESVEEEIEKSRCFMENHSPPTLRIK